MTNDFETHPIGTGKRLAELEGLAFARRRTECGCTTDEDAIAAYRAWLGIDLPDDFGGMGEAEFVRWRRVAEAVRDRLSGREMVAVTRPDTPPIDFADVRKGDRVLASIEGVVTLVRSPYVAIMTEEGVAYQVRIACLDILDRPDPDAELVEQLARAAKRFDALDATDDWDYYLKSARATLAAIRKTHTIEPRSTKGDPHA